MYCTPCLMIGMIANSALNTHLRRKPGVCPVEKMGRARIPCPVNFATPTTKRSTVFGMVSRNTLAGSLWSQAQCPETPEIPRKRGCWSRGGLHQQYRPALGSFGPDTSQARQGCDSRSQPIVRTIVYSQDRTSDPVALTSQKYVLHGHI